jgi:hypothetical protein
MDAILEEQYTLGFSHGLMTALFAVTIIHMAALAKSTAAPLYVPL